MSKRVLCSNNDDDAKRVRLIDFINNAATDDELLEIIESMALDVKI